MKILLSVFLFVNIASAFASNPQIRTCRLNNAQFWSMDITSPKEDNVGFCKYDDSFIGSISLMKYFYDEVNTEAVTAYLKTQDQVLAGCSAAGAQRIISTDSEGAKRKLCVFSDYSFILEETLVKGWKSAFNRKLTRALSF